MAEVLVKAADPIIRAAQFAAKAHEGQVRKGSGRPFIIHPIRVAGRVATLSYATPVMVAAAFLHDVVEDTAVTVEELQATFGDEVAEMVRLLTKDKHEGMSRPERVARNLVRLAEAPRLVQVIKMVDRIDNLLDMSPMDTFSQVYAQESADLTLTIGKADIELRSELIAAIKCIRR